jgi:hypothetical protein
MHHHIHAGNYRMPEMPDSVSGPQDFFNSIFFPAKTNNPV